MDRLISLGVWMLGIIWPQTLPEFERAFDNFHQVLIDFMNVFSEEADAIGRDSSMLSAIPDRPPQVRHQEGVMRRDYAHADLVVDLMFELTRAANHTCAAVRRDVDARFRLDEGALIMVWARTGDETSSDLTMPSTSLPICTQGFQIFVQSG